jgi:solute carrier family 25 carnitine/acylcarnitine transporter 20/29
MEQKKLISFNDFLSGSAAGIVQVLLGQPLDLIKVRMQTQPEIYKSMLQTGKDIYHKEGISAFYKGTLSPLIGISFCVAIQFGANEFAKNFATRRNIKNKDSPTLSIKQLVLCGMFAGSCNTIAISPVELIRIKLQVQGQEAVKMYSGTIDCFRKIISQYGIKGLYQGYSATLFREAPAFATYFGVYEALMQRSEKKYGNRRNIPLFHVMIYGGVAGFCLWVATFPNDVIKSRMQADDLGNRKYKSLLATANSIYMEKGLGGFFKGIAPCLVRAPPINAATFLTFEIVQKMLRKKE